MFVTSNASDVGLTLTTPHNFYLDISYGPLNREVMDIIVPTGVVGSMPVIIYVHGGGFTFNDKSSQYSSATAEANLADGIVTVYLNYDFLETEKDYVGLRGPTNSIKLAIQFLRLHTDTFSLDNASFAIAGGSAGAGLAMWLAYGPDRAEPASPKPILRQSTEVACIALMRPQATYDLVKWETEVFNSLGYSLQDDIDNNEETRKSVARTYANSGSYGSLFQSDTIQYRQEMDMLKMIQDNGGVPSYVRSPDTLYTEIVNNTVPDIQHSPLHGQTIINALAADSTDVVGNIPALNINPPGGETAGEFFRRIMGIV